MVWYFNWPDWSVFDCLQVEVECPCPHSLAWHRHPLPPPKHSGTAMQPWPSWIVPSATQPPQEVLFRGECQGTKSDGNASLVVSQSLLFFNDDVYDMVIFLIQECVWSGARSHPIPANTTGHATRLCRWDHFFFFITEDDVGVFFCCCLFIFLYFRTVLVRILIWT